MAIASALMVLSSLAGLFMIENLKEAVNDSEEVPFFTQTLAYAKPIALLSIILALGSLVAGIFMTRYKNWSRVLAQVIAALYLLFIWCQSIFIAPNNPFDKGDFGIEQLIGALLWTVPIVLFIRYLNKEKVKIYYA